VSATVTKIAELTQPMAPLQPEGSNLGWKIWATWTDPTDLQTKKTYTFSGIATKKPQYTEGASINVFIDPNNMKRYDLDLD
jgi:hypothetical protein